MDAEFWEELNALRKRKLLESKPEPAELNLTTAKLTGLVSTTAPILTAEQKANATESQQRGWLTAWKWSELKPQDWIARLDEGKTICTGTFVKDDRGKFRHRKDLWKGTRLICTDGDKVRSVEHDDDGNDKNPDGVEPFSDINKLLEIYPSLRGDGYAIGHSISSLSEVKPPPHCRTRITFLTERLIKGDEYDLFLRGLNKLYPIISSGRSPSQPVFGNAHRKTTLLGNVLSKARVDFITALGAKSKQRPQPPTTPRSGQESQRPDGDLSPLNTTSSIITKIRSSKQHAKFNSLMRGEIKGYGSQSEADIALCTVIAFWTQDPTLIDTIFRQSNLFRLKWDEVHFSDGATYGQKTVQNSIAFLNEAYNPAERATSPRIKTRIQPRNKSRNKPRLRRRTS